MDEKYKSKRCKHMLERCVFTSALRFTGFYHSPPKCGNVEYRPMCREIAD